MKSKSKTKAPLTPEAAIQKKRRKALDRRDIQSFVSKLILMIVFVFILFGMIFGIYPMKSDDMRPTLRYRDLQIVYRLPSDLYSNEIVVYEVDGETMTGRIAARPGETVEIKDEKVYVNGSQLYEENVYYSTPEYESDVEYPLTLGENEYFILSDYREGAMDSRMFGAVDADQIKGKVIMVLKRSSL